MKDLYIYGAAGLGRETYFWAERNGLLKAYIWKGYIVTRKTEDNPRESSQLIVGEESWLTGLKNEVAVLIGIGNAKARKRIGERLEKFSHIELPSIIDKSVVIDNESCVIGKGVIITPGCILTVNITIGDFTYINLDCTVGHEAIIGKGCVLNPSANISGGVSIGDSVLVGTNATILEYRRISENATIGAAAVVTKDVAANETVIGIPAKPIKKKDKTNEVFSM